MNQVASQVTFQINDSCLTDKKVHDWSETLENGWIRVSLLQVQWQVRDINIQHWNISSGAAPIYLGSTGKDLSWSIIVVIV